jgi:hypothetical protein
MLQSVWAARQAPRVTSAKLHATVSDNAAQASLWMRFSSITRVLDVNPQNLDIAAISAQRILLTELNKSHCYVGAIDRLQVAATDSSNSAIALTTAQVYIADSRRGERTQQYSVIFRP